VPVQNFEVSAPRAGELSLSWLQTNISNEVWYSVTYRSLTHTGNERTFRVDPPSSSYTLTNLDSFTTYTVSIRLACNVGEMGPASTKEVITLTAGTCVVGPTCLKGRLRPVLLVDPVCGS